MPWNEMFGIKVEMEAQPLILAIDDELIIRETLGLLLGDEYRIISVANGMEGIAMALEISPDVILLDVMMPQIDGFDVCRQIRTVPALMEVPIIMITALDDRQSKLEGLRAGADDFITKPFDALELLARVQTITRLNRYRRLTEQRDQLQTLHQELLTSYHKTIEGWSCALDLRDKETEGHTKRVTEKSLVFAQAVGVGVDQLEHIRMGALLHDVGKLGVPDAILLKAGALTEEEWTVMRMHPVYAYQWLSPIKFLESSLDIPYCHHEKWDGSGYPRGLKGEDIPLHARMFAIIDVWDALCSDRPYRKAMTEDQVLEFILAQSGKHFDPALTEVFARLVKEKAFS